ncbi:uncharacterized protein LOC116351917 [Contarinia nasturtii]|uniref:uncharacterized protein LOC116351917 n=1 Tax=Contarinia nasturtii TaxID=265458 RepID=UPI0012D3B3F4|nr:uncharacterized protein LOC116351917 [Contarinia nasturtii]
MNKQKEDYLSDSDAEDANKIKRNKFTQGKLPFYTVLLATACVRLQIGTYICTHLFRAACDTGAQASLISYAAVRALKLPTKPCNKPIDGIGGTTILDKKVCAYLTPWFDSTFRIYAEFLVSNHLSGSHPHAQLDSLRPDSKEITLADRHFDVPSQIDMLLGADIWGMIIRNDLYRHTSGAVMHDTALGHIILGRAPIQQQDASIHAYTLSEIEDVQTNLYENESLDDLLRKFFNNESVVDDVQLEKYSAEENAVETHYAKNTYRNAEGRYVVKIPLKQNKSLGESRNIALKQFYALERKLQSNLELREKYVEFMQAFINLGHMQPAGKIERQMHYYVPHHAVFKDGKLRTVFNGSCKSSNGESLNSIQMIGPKIQHDLQYQIMRFRRHKYAVTADIIKMFRMVRIHPSQWDLQRIFWRESPNEKLREYHVTVVMYGLASSTFEAVRSMIQCARDYAKSHPNAADIIINCFYMDDGLWGADTIAKLKQLCMQVEYVLKQGGFSLAKWASNSISIEKEMHAELTNAVEMDKDLTLKVKEAKVLGIRWLKESDELTISVQAYAHKEKCTKRDIISEIAKLYDPNGYVAPVVIVAKMLMQDIWKQRDLSWDKLIPESFQIRWNEFTQNLCDLSKFRIPRWLKMYEQSKIQIHMFCDATIKAYGAVIYTRTIDTLGVIHCTLFTAKSKVAPLKAITIPRMELLAALLGSKLTHNSIQACEMKNAEIHFWSDSMVTLHWIGKNPLQLKTYVSNRVAMIQEYSTNASWKHVKTQDNPADLISRGMKISDFVRSDHWKHGPTWLSKDQGEWPTPKLEITNAIQEEIKKEVKPPVNVNLAIMMLPVRIKRNQYEIRELWYRTNNWKKMIRITVYVLRFIQNTRIIKDRTKWIQGLPQTQELKNALRFWIKYAQAQTYKKEILALKSSDAEFKTKSNIRSLNPFLDENDMLRVGGRIDKAIVSYHIKHPIIIPPRSRLAYLLIQEAHNLTLHGGIQQMMAYTRRIYWIPQLRSQARQIVNQCVKCTRYAQKTVQQIMAELPAVRVRPANPFNSVGIDLAGPFTVKITDKLNLNTRSKATIPKIKGYIAVFVCMVTRAVHLEAIMDISADAFLRAFQRFVARRGFPEVVYSDNGTNFVASDRLLQEAMQSWTHESVQQYASWNGTKWRFITPGAPHEGGIWEAAVKSMKHHLRRVMGTQQYSYEGMSTLICGIEACLNSRPICAMSDDPNDLETLTPAHFLVGKPLTLPLHEDMQHVKTAKSLFNALQAQIQGFWTQWSQDYLHTLTQRPKWREAQANIMKGQLVLIKNENMPPTYWAMARVIEVNASQDTKVRSVKLKTQNTILERSVRKLCILPTDQELNYWVEN